MDDVINQGEDEHSHGSKDFGASVCVAFEGLVGEEAFEDILSQGRKEFVEDFKDVEYNIEFDGCLTSDAMVHSTGVQLHQDHAAAYDDSTL